MPRVELLKDVDGIGQKGDRVSLAPELAEKLIRNGDAKEVTK